MRAWRNANAFNIVATPRHGAAARAERSRGFPDPERTSIQIPKNFTSIKNYRAPVLNHATVSSSPLLTVYCGA